MTQNRKRGRNAREEEVEFMPLSKRINNLHINGSLFFENSTIMDQPTQPSLPEWGPGPPTPYIPLDTPPESSHMNFDVAAPRYNPVLSESENPHYYYKNKLLFEMHTERMQRNGHSY